MNASLIIALKLTVSFSYRVAILRLELQQSTGGFFRQPLLFAGTGLHSGRGPVPHSPATSLYRASGVGEADGHLLEGSVTYALAHNCQFKSLLKPAYLNPPVKGSNFSKADTKNIEGMNLCRRTRNRRIVRRTACFQKRAESLQRHEASVLLPKPSYMVDTTLFFIYAALLLVTFQHFQLVVFVQ
jgi:hypothetical protein